MIGAIRETHINADKGYLLGDPITLAEPWERSEVADLFAMSQRQFGRCVSSIYIDTEQGTRRIGWVFQRREAYEDAPTEFFTHEVWIETLEKPDTVEVQRHPHYLD